MITLRAGAAEAVILPEAGAAFARLADAGRDLLVPVAAGVDPNRGSHGAFLMAPWTNRLDGGRITVGGTEHRMPINRPDEDNSLHGFLRELPWTVAELSADSAVLDCRFDRPPFHGTARMTTQLSPDALRLSVAITNTAEVATPFGIGWHPYFPRPAGTRLRAVARTALSRDARNLPVGAHAVAGLDGAEEVLDALDTHFAGWDGTAEITWPDGLRLLLRADGAWATNLQVFAPRVAAAIAVEPVSHAPDAANRTVAADHGPMHVLPRGATLDGSLMIHWR